MPADLFSRCMFFDLPDYRMFCICWLFTAVDDFSVSYMITGSMARSSCSLVCKCSYIPPGATPAAQGWNAEFFRMIGLDQMVQSGYKQLGGVLGQNHTLVLTAGMPVGRGLSKGAAERLGLVEGTSVGSGVIDALVQWILISYITNNN